MRIRQRRILKTKALPSLVYFILPDSTSTSPPRRPHTRAQPKKTMASAPCSPLTPYCLLPPERPLVRVFSPLEWGISVQPLTDLGQHKCAIMVPCPPRGYLSSPGRSWRIPSPIRNGGHPSRRFPYSTIFSYPCNNLQHPATSCNNLQRPQPLPNFGVTNCDAPRNNPMNPVLFISGHLTPAPRPHLGYNLQCGRRTGHYRNSGLHSIRRRTS